VRPYYTIDLKSLNPDLLTDDAANAIEALPGSYTAATEQKFFAFFRKYGMYFIKSVTMGGRLTYYSAVNKRKNETTEALSVKVKASYDGLTGKGSAAWSSVDKQQFASSRISIETQPPGSLNSANPQFGDDLSSGDGYSVPYKLELNNKSQKMPFPRADRCVENAPKRWIPKVPKGSPLSVRCGKL
jgi:hypothetical protein